MKMVRWMVMGGALLAVGALLDSKYTRRSHQQAADEHLDDALDGTFPASDPTSTQDFAIPVNRA